MTLLVRDEEDILPAHIGYHLDHGVDYIVAMDNLSVDRTPDILRHYRDLGVLEYHTQRSDDYRQSDWVTQLAQAAARRHAADWVVNSDADEFWWAPDGQSLKSVLNTVDHRTKALTVERVNFLPRLEHAREPFFERMTLREVQSFNAVGQPLPPKVCHRAMDDVLVGQGNHHVRQGGSAVVASPSVLTILHFPLRTYAQFENKIVKGGAAYRRNQDLPESTGATWRRLYEKHEQGVLFDEYEKQAVDDDRAALLTAAGTCVTDTRLRDKLRHIALFESPPT